MPTDTITNRALAPYFEREGFLQGSPYDGTLETTLGRRVIVLPSELIQGLHRTLLDETGRAWPVIAYRCGRSWGEKLLTSWDEEWENFYGVDITNAEFAVFENWMKRLFAHNGWGGLELEFGRQDDGLVEFRLADSVLVRVLEELDGFDATRVCAIFSGLFGAIGSKLAGRELEAVEVACEHDGHDHCSFMLSTPDRIESVRRLRLGDASRDELMTALLEN